jgi:hypothetical protein
MAAYSSDWVNIVARTMPMRTATMTPSALESMADTTSSRFFAVGPTFGSRTRYMPTSRYVLVINSAAGSQAATLNWSRTFAANGDRPAGAPAAGGCEHVTDTAMGSPDAVPASLVMSEVSVSCDRTASGTRSA